MKKQSFYAALTMLILFSGCSQKEEKKEMETLKVAVEECRSSAQMSETPYVGIVEAQQTTLVSFMGMGMVKNMNVSEGQHVRKGQVLATIDDTQARNALEAAKSQLDQALDAQARMRQLHENQSLPDMKWVEIESKVRQAQSQYEMCKKTLADCVITSPCDGVIGKEIVSLGETALPAEPILRVLDINRVKIRVNIPEKEIARIGENQPTLITVDALPGKTFMGGKIEKGVHADQITHTYDIRIQLDNPQQELLPGMVAQVRIQHGDSATASALSLPVKAIQKTADHTLFVWCVKDGKAHRVDVTLGEAFGNRVVIASGLSEGQQVIVDGYQKVSEQQPVTF